MPMRMPVVNGIESLPASAIVRRRRAGALSGGTGPEGAIAAVVAAEGRQRNEALGREGDGASPAAVARVAGAREELVEPRVGGLDQRARGGVGDHCSGVREAATLRGWPETRRDPALFCLSLFISRVREAATLRGWPETRRDPALFCLSLFISRGREAATLRGWPETRRDPALFCLSLFISRVREAATLRGWPETRRDPALFCLSLFISPRSA